MKTDPGSNELTSKIGQPQSLSQGHSDPNTTQDGMHFRDCEIPDELVDFPRDEDGIIHLKDMQISKLTPVPSKLAGITKDDDPRLHRHVESATSSSQGTPQLTYLCCAHFGRRRFGLGSSGRSVEI